MLRVNNKVVTEPSIISETFNNLFLNVGSNHNRNVFNNPFPVRRMTIFNSNALNFTTV